MPSDLSQRHLVGEAMDDPSLPAPEHKAALAGLARINVLSGADRALWRALRRRATWPRGRPLRVLDVATGSGDIPLALWKRAHGAGRATEIAGCDLSGVAVDCAQANAQRCGADVRFFRADALRGELPEGFDVICCSLFLHHLEEDQAVALLAKMAAASEGLVLVHDLVRTRASMMLVWAASRIVTRSRVVHGDAMLSIRSAFTMSEARALASAAGLDGAIVRPSRPCRFLLRWSRTP